MWHNFGVMDKNASVDSLSNVWLWISPGKETNSKKKNLPKKLMHFFFLWIKLFCEFELTQSFEIELTQLIESFILE